MQSVVANWLPIFGGYFLGAIFLWIIGVLWKSTRQSTGDMPKNIYPASGFWLGKTGYAVILLGCSNKISTIKYVREVKPDLGLYEAKKLVDSAPAVIGEYLTSTEAEVVKQAFEAVGADVEIREAKVSVFS